MKGLTTILCAILMGFGFLGSVQGQTTDDAWINEFHYDNASTDEGEFVEVVIKDAGSYTLSDFTVHLYNGSNGSTYDDYSLDTFIEGETEGDYTIYYKLISGIQNGAPDGFSLDYNGTLVQFISYEGEIGPAGDGPAIGETSEDVGVDESSTTQSGESLQLTGSGYGYDDFNWIGPIAETPGSVNSGQSLVPTVQFSEAGATVNEADGMINVAVQINIPDENAVDVDVTFQQSISTAEGADFTTSTTQTLSFGSGANDGDILNASFTLYDDSDYEGIETAEFILSNISTSGSATINGQTDYTLTIKDDDTPNVVINEFLADPGGQDADGNGNLAASGSDDEFIELLNNENISVDISGWEVLDNGTDVKYTFTSGTILPPSGSVIVFSKDIDQPDPVGVFGGTIVVISDNVLSFNNDEDTPTLKDDGGSVIDSYNYTSTTSGVSIVRNPDGTGEFVDHDNVNGAVGNYSPGTKTDGSLFTTSLVIEGNAGWRMLSAPVENMSVSEITDDTPIQGFGEDGFDKNFYTGYDGSAFTAPDDLTGNLSSGEGFILYFYNNTEASSATLPVVIDVGSNSEPSTDVNVSLHSNGDSWNLLGNPYQTAFDITSLSPPSGSLASAVGQIWSDEDESYITTSANDDKVAPGQGFFIQNSDAPSVELPTSGKTTGTRFYKTNTQKAFVQLALISEGANGEGEQRDISSTLYFRDGALGELDKWDAEKLYPLKSSYSLLNIVSDGSSKVKAQDSRAFENMGDETFYLEIEASNVKSRQTLEWNKSSNIPEEWKFTFADNKTGEEIIMDNNFSYQFSQEEINQTSSLSASKLAKSLTVDTASETPRFTITLSKGETTNVEKPSDTPQKFALEQNYPNPFNPATVISYQIPAHSEVTLAVYNVMGQKVATLVNETQSAGNYKVSWDAGSMSSGVYYYRLQSAGKILTQQMTFIK